MRVRPYEQRDREALHAMAHRLPPAVPWRDPAAWAADVHKWLDGALGSADPNHAVLVAETGSGEVAGYVTIETRRHYTGEVHGYIGQRAVAERFARLGCGRALMTAAEEWLRGRGFKRVGLHTGATNVSAQAFYAELGYVPEDIALSKEL